MNRSCVIELSVLISIIVLVCVQDQIISSLYIKEKSVSSATSLGISLSTFIEAQIIFFIITIFIAINIVSIMVWLFGNFRRTESQGLLFNTILARRSILGENQFGSKQRN